MIAQYDWDAENTRTGRALMASPRSWVEAFPRVALDCADVGGDLQDGTAWGRRFVYWHPRPGCGLFAALNVYFYAAVEYPSDDGNVPGVPWVQRQVEMLVCTDFADPGGTEIHSDCRFTDLPTSGWARIHALELAEAVTVSSVPFAQLWLDALPHLEML